MTLSLATEERSVARARAATLDAVFEEFMRKSKAEEIEPALFARIMLEARNMTIERLNHADAHQPPLEPRAASRFVSLPFPLHTDIDTLEELAQQAPDTPTGEDGHVLATLPAALAENLIAALSTASTPRAPRRSLRNATKAEAAALRARLALLRDDFAANEHSAVKGMMPEILRRVGIDAEGAAHFIASRAALAGHIEAISRAHDQRMGAFPATEELLREIGVESAPQRPQANDGATQQQIVTAPKPAAGPSTTGHLQKPQVSAGVVVDRCMVPCRATG